MSKIVAAIQINGYEEVKLALKQGLADETSLNYHLLFLRPAALSNSRRLLGPGF